MSKFDYLDGDQDVIVFPENANQQAGNSFREAAAAVLSFTEEGKKIRDRQASEASYTPVDMMSDVMKMNMRVPQIMTSVMAAQCFFVSQAMFASGQFFSAYTRQQTFDM